MPVKVFEPRSSIQRIVDLWSGASLHLTRAALAKDPVERLKHVITYSVSSMYLCFNMAKPFNPLLGETH